MNYTQKFMETSLELQTRKGNVFIVPDLRKKREKSIIKILNKTTWPPLS